ncbi:MAG: bifunctional uroporphyrinogen-III C-methyltransferase/uroporphyrinogen-III synthase [Actinomycetota bacterium]|nr:bifunctional uroporphyrinogen-III C-methyltransferase/uroporphyrinogen-III synthase [Actinomycetota bacterium]
MSPTRTRRPAGQVALVGTGTGDPGLLTQRAAELLSQADLVVADERVAAAVLALAHPDAEVQLVPAGGLQAPVLVAAGKEGKRVVRLFPGDPYLTDDGAKEAEAVVKGKLRLEVVPGLPAPVAVPAYAGVPVGLPRTVARVDDKLDWAGIAGAPGTLVLTCDVSEVAKAASALVEHGRKATTDIAVTIDGTTTSQRTVVATLDTVETAVHGLFGEAVVVVGDAAKKVDKLGWFEQRALYGWRVLVPRTRDQASSLSDALRAYGAIPVEVPTIAVEPPRTPAPMERAIKGLVTGRYLWIAFTSVNAVKAVLEKLQEFGLDARAFAGVKIAAVGDSTAAALRAYGIEPELVPSGEQSSEGLLKDWQPYDEVFDPMDRVLLPRADIATDTLVAGLKDLGWAVDDVTAYRTVRAAPPPAETREALKGGGFDAVLFTSSSTVRNLVGIAGKPHDSTVLVAIGPQTKATAEELGLRIDVQAVKPDVSALVEGLAEFALELRAAGELPPSARRRKGVKKAKR